MKKYLLSFILFAGFLGTTKFSYADHCVGADLTYTNVGIDSFLITVTFYRDCQGIQWPTEAFVDVQSASTGQYTYLDAPLIGNPIDISPLLFV